MVRQGGGWLWREVTTCSNAKEMAMEVVIGLIAVEVVVVIESREAAECLSPLRINK